ncbi:hypothetical protein BB559_005835 [Furculomyces boomerangus]|uniref:Aminotransferase class V domain-containing protein n=2 Tax=Harpellales TaxID=61421 RepID=A0A2T9Y6D4_9FUNG|nr:hypothetical protein BB559_005835 [Furculomyces boomerangus]PVZ97578.1 hypothetical protein BB558_006454 [Smittium angustum]PWA02673.1 hypothetical protein BB558_001164 [Smittium angustum]
MTIPNPKLTDLDPTLDVIPVPKLGEIPEFGHKMREIFMLNPNYLSLNHGSFGAVPKYVGDYSHYYYLCSERNPDIWIRHTVVELYNKAVERVAPYLGCKDPNELALVPNATFGLNAVLRSMKLDSNDALFRYSVSYGACSNTISYVCSTSGAQAIDIPINFPCSSSEIVEITKKTIQKVKESGKNIKFAMIDTISSVPAIIFPFVELTKVFKDEGALVFIDGAHSLGQINVDIESIGCDYFVTNAHKWFYTKRGTAVMYVAKHLQESVKPLVISWAYSRNTGWNDSFFWQGTVDFSSFLSINAAIDFVEAAGGLKKIQDYTHDLAIKGMNLLESKYGMTPLTRDETQIGCLINCKVPLEAGNLVHDKVGEAIGDILLKNYSAFGAFYEHNGAWWVRLSAQIYLELDDFDKFGKVMTEAIKKEIQNEMNATK